MDSLGLVTSLKFLEIQKFRLIFSRWRPFVKQDLQKKFDLSNKDSRNMLVEYKTLVTNCLRAKLVHLLSDIQPLKKILCYCAQRKTEK